jgi:hypothetical protein
VSSGDIVDRLLLAAKPETLAHVFTLTVVRCSLLVQAANEIDRLRDENKRIKVAMQMAVDDLEERLPKSAQSGLMETLAEDLLPAHSMNYRRWSHNWVKPQKEG